MLISDLPSHYVIAAIITSQCFVTTFLAPVDEVSKRWCSVGKSVGNLCSILAHDFKNVNVSSEIQRLNED